MLFSTLALLLTFLLHLVPCHGIIPSRSAQSLMRSGVNLMRCPPRTLKGGRVRLRSKGRVAKYVCLRGYQVLGDKYSTCVRGKWDSPIPICINRGCLSLNVTHGRVLELYRGALVTFDCDPGYSLVGSSSLYCNGARWNGTAPICKEMKVSSQKSCDFETEDLCGWSHDSNHDFDWRRHNFATPSGHVGTGPSYDHSLGPGLNGHYMYLETSSPRLQNDTARLFSPVFAAPAGHACFSFWYHMYGLTTGLLNVYLHSKDSTLLFSLSGNQGDDWRQANIPLPLVNSSFQIVIEGVRGAGYEGDTAVDDVQLAEGDCIGNTSESVEESGDDWSCAGRCFVHSVEPTSCECTADCLSNNTCCLDYPQLCSSTVEVPTTNIFVSENVISTDISFDVTTPAMTTAVVKTTETTNQLSTYNSSSFSNVTYMNSVVRVTALLAGSTTSIVVTPNTSNSTTSRAITTSNTSTTLISTSVGLNNTKSQFTATSPIRDVTSTHNLPKTSTSSFVKHFSVTSTKSPLTLLTTSVNPYKKPQFPNVSPIGNKPDGSKYLPSLPTTLSVSKLLSVTSTNNPTKLLTTSVNAFNKSHFLTVSPIGNKLYSSRPFPKLSTSFPAIATKLSSTSPVNTSPKSQSTSVNLSNYTHLSKYLPTVSPIKNKNSSSTQAFTKPSTSAPLYTSKQFPNPTKKPIYRVSKPTVAQTAATKVNQNQKSERFDLNNTSTMKVYFFTRPSTTQITTPIHTKVVTSKSQTSLASSSAKTVEVRDRFHFGLIKKTLPPKYRKTYNVTLVALSRTSTMSPKTMRNSSVEIPKSKNDVLHPVWKNRFMIPPPLPTLEPKPIPGFETLPSTKSAASTSQDTTVPRTSAVEEWKWKSKYREQVEAPVHAPVQAMPASPTNWLVLTCCGMLVATAVLVTVCVVRRRKINRGNDEDDELDIRFIPSDEFLDFTMARPSLEETRLCEGPS